MKQAIVFASLALLMLAGCKSEDSFSLLPGQTCVVRNDKFERFHVRSEYPVRIKGAYCSNERAVDADMSCERGDFTVTDLRPSILAWGHSNRVVVTAARF